MAIKKYIGARYAPKFMGAWDKTSEYAALSVVYTNEQNYVSRKTVPANTEITNTEFWIKSADWNAQVAQYNENVEQYEKDVQNYSKTVNALIGKVVYTYDTKDDMAADKRVRLNDTLMTCGYAEVDDKKGSFYKVVVETSATAIALQNGLFAKPFTLAEYAQNYVTPEDFGAVGDGTTDDTQAINKALEYSDVLNLKNKTYLVSADPSTTIAIKAYNKIINGNGATIKLAPYTGDTYSIIDAKGTTQISNLTIIGDREEHAGTTGEWGFGIGITNCSKANIENVTIKNCWGDGIYLGSETSSTGAYGCANVAIINCLIDNNRRNGISIINCNNFTIDGCTISNTNGTNPQCGIDIERNTTTEITKGIIKNCTFIDNHFSHISQDNSSDNNTIENCIFKSINKNAAGDVQCNSKKVTIVNCISNPSKRATLICDGGEIECFNHITTDSNTDENGSYDSFIYTKTNGTFNIRNCYAASHNANWRGMYVDKGAVNIYNSVFPDNRYHAETTVINGCNPMVLTGNLTVTASSFPGDITAMEDDNINITTNLTGLSSNTFTVQNKGTGQIRLTGDISETIAAYTSETFFWDGNALHKMN